MTMAQIKPLAEPHPSSCLVVVDVDEVVADDVAVVVAVLAQAAALALPNVDEVLRESTFIVDKSVCDQSGR